MLFQLMQTNKLSHLLKFPNNMVEMIKSMRLGVCLNTQTAFSIYLVCTQKLLIKMCGIIVKTPIF